MVVTAPVQVAEVRVDQVSRKRARDDDDDEEDPNKTQEDRRWGCTTKADGGLQGATQEGCRLPPNQQKAAGPLHLSAKGGNYAGSLRTRLDR